MKIIDLTEEFFTQEQYIQEVTNLFVAVGHNHALLSESTINEANIWKIIKKSAGGIWRGVKTADEAINKLGRIAQNTRPVKNFDEKASKIIESIKGKLPDKTIKRVRRYHAWGLKNPIKQTLIISALGAIAALALGPASGAGISAIIRFLEELTKGEKASTSIGQGIKSTMF